ncbi:hypothetical protein [Mesorhizobium onobrychidis]|uniref:Uncharacterized protein n=1 Tax=Mesorhizobium onobrychidis TaxID=2775404 RepID=A0ABY5R2B3_9HYPH|nr:hypothetical protein [Mesorhizobium onobrychidis]UVC17418.1 hypothetical protein IHQ72_10030 [Mesorhizobium onobrychidis]
MSFLIIAVFVQPPSFADFESVTLLVRDEKRTLCLLTERLAIQLVDVEPKAFGPVPRQQLIDPVDRVTSAMRPARHLGDLPLGSVRRGS